ncbi:Fe3+-citrate ABC transporter substrate-binding protein [Vibrio splendidus]
MSAHIRKTSGATGHRFISKGKTAYKIHIHTPDDTVLHKSVGFVKMGEEKGLKKALKLRNQIGYELWGKHWRRVLKDEYLMLRLPHSLEPKIVLKPNPISSNSDHRIECYIAKWSYYDIEGKLRNKTLVRSVNKHGRLSAYSQTKKALLEAYEDIIDIIVYMGRTNTIGMK